MNPPRPLRCLATGVAACALLGLTAAPAQALEPRRPDGPLRSREFSAPELTVSSSHLALDDVLARLPNRAAWERFRGERLAAGTVPVTVFVDPRGGTATNVMGAFPLLPGRGVGNRVSRAMLGARLGREVARVDAVAVAEAARLFLLEHADVLGIDPSQLGAVRAAQVSETLWQVSAPQVVGGVPVRDARLALTISHGNVVTFGTEGWGTAAVSTEAAVSPDRAIDAAFAYAGGRSPSDVLLQARPELEVVATAPAGSRAEAAFAGPVGAGYAHRLVWSVMFQRAPEDARWEALVDAASGEVLSFQDRNHYIDRQITGGVYPLTNTGLCPTPQTCGEMQAGWPMPFADTGLPAPGNVTNSAGMFDFTGVPPVTTLSGPFVRVADSCGLLSATSAAGDVDLGGLNGQHDCTIGSGGGPGNTAASRSAFYEVNKLAEQARGWLPFNAWLRSRLVANMNIPQTCNAFWNGTSINFYRSGGGCGNTGEIGAVFDHEWGHGLDDNDAGGVLSNSSEGYADIAAIYRLQASCVGHGFSIGTTPGACGLTADGTGPNRNESQVVGGLHCDLDCSGVRDADWDKHADHTPDTALGFVCSQCGGGTGPCGRQVHCAAAPSRQAAWDLVTRDLTSPPFGLDRQTAFLVGNRLFYQGSGNVGAWHACTCGSSSSGCGATNAYIQWLTADDDNGNLADGTPHMTAIFAAFDRHGIACAAPAPVNSGCAEVPSAPTLTAAPGPYAASLEWSAAPGASTYWVLRSEGHAGCDFGKTKIAEVTGTAFTDTEVAAGRSYAYNVVAQGASPACYSAVSNCAQVTPTHSTDPDFFVSCAPSSLPVVQGQSGVSTCTVSSANGFGSEVSLACGPLPADATCRFEPPSVTPEPSGSAASTLTVTVAATTPGGTSALQVSATSGALTRTAPLSLAVLVPGFTVSCTPPGFSVIQGQSASATCTVTSQNTFSAPVDLACANLPAGAACSFSATPVTPPSNGAVTSTLTVTTTAATPGGFTAFQVVATSGALTQSATLSLNVLVPAFGLACVPNSLSVVQGTSVTTSCRVTSINSFSEPVAFSCAALPAGGSCTFDPPEVTSPPNGLAASTLTVTTSDATPLGARAFQVVGAGAGLTRSTNVTLNVTAPPDFALTCVPAALSASPGGNVTSLCRVTSLRGFTAPVVLICAGLPAGVTCNASPAIVTPPPNGQAASTLLVTTAPSVATGLYPFTVTGRSGTLTHSAALTLRLTRTVYFDNFESAGGWATNPAGTDTANRGRWERAVPVQYTAGGIVIQNGTTPSPVNDLVTGASTSGSNGDIDNGTTSIQSPPITLPGGVLTLSFAYYFSHRNDSSADDFFRASVVGPSGTTLLFEELGTAVNDPAVFATRSLDLTAFAGQTVRILFSARDGGVDNLLEAAVDDVRIVVQ
jgi:trimeric autotransporter adhesin